MWHEASNDVDPLLVPHAGSYIRDWRNGRSRRKKKTDDERYSRYLIQRHPKGQAPSRARAKQSNRENEVEGFTDKRNGNQARHKVEPAYAGKVQIMGGLKGQDGAAHWGGECGGDRATVARASAT